MSVEERAEKVWGIVPEATLARGVHLSNVSDLAIAGRNVTTQVKVQLWPLTPFLTNV